MKGGVVLVLKSGCRGGKSEDVCSGGVTMIRTIGKWNCECVIKLASRTWGAGGPNKAN